MEDLVGTAIARWDGERVLLRLDDGSHRELPLVTKIDDDAMPPPGSRLKVRLNDAGQIEHFEPVDG